MRYYRAELVFDISKAQRDRAEYPDRHIPRAVVLVDEDDNRIELLGVREASMSWGLTDARVLRLEILVRGIDEVYSGGMNATALLEKDRSDDAAFVARGEVEVPDGA